MKLNDLSGKRFGRLTVISRAEDIVYSTGRRHVVWNCVCDCGNVKKVRAMNLSNHHVASCGCYRDETRRKVHKKHGKCEHRLYTTWTNIKQRCYNENSDDYNNYGGRGIGVCGEWLNSFEDFYNWAMSSGYADNLTIDRIDVNGNYCADNCRWVSRYEQRHNRRDSAKPDLKGSAVNAESD